MPYKKDVAAADHNTSYQLGISCSKGLEIYYDTQILSEKLVDYFEDTYKNFEFIDFFDPVFVKYFKQLIKDPDKFNKFLKDISFTNEEFFQTIIYVCPHCFTTNLIKYVREHYTKVK